MKIPWDQVMCIAVGLLIFYGVSIWSSSIEGFEGGESITLEDPEKYYDQTYAAIYKALWHSKQKLEYEQVSFQDICLADWNTTDVKILDLCCGVAPHACWFKNMGVKYTGVDNSLPMLEQARTDCPSTTFQKGDVTLATLFPPKTFSHTFLLGFSAYMFPNIKTISDNAYMWTQPGGYFVVHLVEPDKYDPILDLATPFAAFSLQKYSYDRQTKSEIFFDEFKYTGIMKKKKNEEDATFDEVLTYYNPETSPGKIKYREQIQRWHMPDMETVIAAIKTSGFQLKEKVHLISAGKEYQYLVYFTK